MAASRNKSVNKVENSLPITEIPETSVSINDLTTETLVQGLVPATDGQGRFTEESVYYEKRSVNVRYYGKPGCIGRPLRRFSSIHFPPVTSAANRQSNPR